jgi:hypothetical protein
MNIREQFLKVTLPHKASFLNLSVDGKPETPVVAEGEPDTFLIKLASNQAGFQVAFTYADHTTPLGILSWPTVTLPRFSLHSDTESWTIGYPNMERAYYINSSFDMYTNYPGNSISLQKPYTPVQEPRSANFIVLSSYTLGLLRTVSLLVLPILYFIWFVSRPSLRSVLLLTTGTLALIGSLSALLGEFSITWNIGLTLMLYIAQKSGGWSSTFRRALSIDKGRKLKDLTEALKKEDTDTPEE